MSEKEARGKREELFRLLAEAEDTEALTATLVRRMVARAEEQEPEWGALLRAVAIPRWLDEGVMGVLPGSRPGMGSVVPPLRLRPRRGL